MGASDDGWKGDMTHEYTPLMASLDRFIDFQKPGFKGMEALVAERNKGPKERFVPLVLDEAKDCDAPACAPVYRGEELVGLVTSGGYGHTIGKSIALAYVRTDLAQIGEKLRRSAGAAKLLMFRARQALKNCLLRKHQAAEHD